MIGPEYDAPPYFKHRSTPCLIVVAAMLAGWALIIFVVGVLAGWWW